MALAAVVAGCAINRPHVKSLRDPQAYRIQFDDPIQTTVSALNAIPAHCGPTSDQRGRHEEFQVYEVIGRINRVKLERDHDIHVVLEDPDDARKHVVVELDDPDFHGNVASPYRSELATARRMFEALQRQSGSADLNDLRGVIVRVTGVGFFDINHFQAGRSRSCIELHPILTIERVTESWPRPAPASSPWHPPSSRNTW
jgi:hypothetical protein